MPPPGWTAKALYKPRNIYVRNFCRFFRPAPTPSRRLYGAPIIRRCLRSAPRHRTTRPYLFPTASPAWFPRIPAKSLPKAFGTLLRSVRFRSGYIAPETHPTPPPKLLAWIEEIEKLRSLIVARRAYGARAWCNRIADQKD